MTRGSVATIKDVIVLKFGGSVLTSIESLQQAVLEIHRWRRRGSRVVAVVSALAGRTDELIAEAHAAGVSHSFALADRVARGEHESARLLSDRLWDAGIGARVLTPSDLELRAEGDALDSTPVSMKSDSLWSTLDQDLVAVIPGFVAVDARARTVLLGRGGSDLTALFLAERLGARCRLLKDVDGLYESNPAIRTAPPPRRYRTASFADALATDGSILQHKALRFAEARSLQFEVGACGRDAATQIGRVSEFAESDDSTRGPRRTRIALLGCGTIGSEVARALLARRSEHELVGIAVGDLERRRAHWIPRDLLCSTATALSRSPDVVIELLGLVPSAEHAVAHALHSGADVVTANKGWLARSAAGWTKLARQLGRRILFSAAVGGAVPVLETIASLARQGRSVISIRAVTNATANFLLDSISRGTEFEAALEDARRRGLAESDSSRDLDGSDAADKLAVLGLGLERNDADSSGLDRNRIEVDRARISPSSCAVAQAARARGERLRQVASLHWEDGQLIGRVRLESLTADDPLHGVDDDRNRFVLPLDDGSVRIVDGRGAGPRPTLTAILGDLEEIVAQRHDARVTTGVRDEGAIHAI